MDRNQAIVELVKSLPEKQRFWPVMFGIALRGIGITAIVMAVITIVRLWFTRGA